MGDELAAGWDDKLLKVNTDRASSKLAANCYLRHKGFGHSRGGPVLETVSSITS